MSSRFFLVLALVVVLAGGCVRRGGDGNATEDGDSNIVEGSEVYGEIIPADEDVAMEIDEFAGAGEFSTETEVSGDIDTSDGGETSAGGFADGFRVQVLAVSYKDNADRVADEVRDGLVGYPVYVEFINDMYKVRVGDCAARGEAETLRAKLVEIGYEDAWIVKSEVNVQ